MARLPERSFRTKFSRVTNDIKTCVMPSVKAGGQHPVIGENVYSQNGWGVVSGSCLPKSVTKRVLHQKPPSD